MDLHLLKLQPRLHKIAELVPKGARLADIGTDHGYLPVWLLQNKMIRSAIASDIRPMPLEHARRTAEIYGIRENIDFRLGGGLEVLSPDEADTIVIAGMGGEMISDILTAAAWTLTGKYTLLLQAMSKPEYLRKWLSENGYCFQKECLVWDKEMLYPVFQVTAGVANALTPAQQYGGVLLQNDPLYRDYLTRQIGRLERAVAGLRCSAREEDQALAAEWSGIRDTLVKESEALA